MDKQLEELKDSVNYLMSEENRFTEAQKYKIRKKIEKERNKQNKSIKSPVYRKGLELGVITILVFFIVGIVYQSINQESYSNERFNEKTQDNSTSSSSESSANKSMPDDKGYKNETEKDILKKEELIYEPIFPLSETLVTVYKKYKSSNYTQEILQGLPPQDIMRIYWYADINNDFDARYGLYIKDEKYFVPSKEKLIEDKKNNSLSEQDSKDDLYKELKSVKQLELFYLDESRKEAVIKYKGKLMENNQHFRLIKNNNGIWTVAFMPTQ